MGTPKIRTATWDDAPKIGAIMPLAFAGDPFVRWLFPNPQEFIDDAVGHPARAAGAAFDDGSAYVIGDMCGASVWLAPGVKINRDHEGAPRVGSPQPVFPPEFAELMEISASYCPEEPHWYLSLIVVDPLHRAKGYGTALMQHSLARCDRDRMPAYLESTNASNLTLYQRFGFELLAKVTVGNSPARYPMWRPPIG